MFVVAFAKVINLATPIKLLTHYTKGTQLFILTPAAYKVTSSLRVIRAYSSYLMLFPSQYYALLLFLEYLALEDGSPLFR